jgi:predicted RNA binding protein YcfA (HicA-like mRNA interferase family)
LKSKKMISRNLILWGGVGWGSDGHIGVSKHSEVTGKRLITALKRAGFLILRVRGSHHFFRHPDGRTTVVPVHSGESLGPGLLAKVLPDVEITRNELEELLA